MGVPICGGWSKYNIYDHANARPAIQYVVVLPSLLRYLLCNELKAFAGLVVTVVCNKNGLS